MADGNVRTPNIMGNSIIIIIMKCGYSLLPISSLHSLQLAGGHLSKLHITTFMTNLESIAFLLHKEIPIIDTKLTCCMNKEIGYILSCLEIIGLLQQTITWYKIHHTGGQAHYYSHTGTLKQ